MGVIKIIAGVSNYNGPELRPYRLDLPDFLSETSRSAKEMVNNLTEDYCEEAWVVGDKPWESELLWRAVRSIDWQKVEVLEYDWEKKDHWGEREHDPFEIWDVCWDEKKLRCPGLEPFIVEEADKSQIYAKELARESWLGWNHDDLVKNPCWMFYYAKNVCKGKLPEVLDNAMMMWSFKDSDNPWVKRYFGTKRYRKSNRKALSSIQAA